VRAPHNKPQIAIKAKISLLCKAIFDEMTTSFLIARFGSLGKDVPATEFADAMQINFSMTTLGEFSMKKTLLALAVIGTFAGVAHAQSSVTISGNVDIGFQSMNADGENNDANGIADNGSSTSSINFSGTEDLGGGLKAGFLFGTNVTYGDGSTTMGNGQNYLSLGGNFGTFKLGSVNTQVMSASSASQPFGTAIGSGYSSNFSRLDGITVSFGGVSGATTLATSDNTTATSAGGRPIRTPGSIYYTSPSFSGFKVTAGMAFENDKGNQTDAGMQEIAVGYNGNGLNVCWVTTKLPSATMRSAPHSRQTATSRKPFWAQTTASVRRLSMLAGQIPMLLVSQLTLLHTTSLVSTKSHPRSH
jgi:predicted porin